MNRNFFVTLHCRERVLSRRQLYKTDMTTSESTSNTAAESRPACAVGAENQTPSGRSGARIMVWLSVVLAVATWCTLLWGNGLVAAGIAVAGIVLAAIGMRRASTALRRLAVTAVIAQLVPAIVVLAYVVVLHFIVA